MRRFHRRWYTVTRSRRSPCGMHYTHSEAAGGSEARMERAGGRDGANDGDGGREGEARSPGGRRRAHVRALQPCTEVELAGHRRRRRRRVAPARRPRIIKRNGRAGRVQRGDCNGGHATQRPQRWARGRGGGAAAHVAHARSRSTFASCSSRAAVRSRSRTHAWTQRCGMLPHSAARVHRRASARGRGRTRAEGGGTHRWAQGRGLPGSCGSGCAWAR